MSKDSCTDVDPDILKMTEDSGTDVDPDILKMTKESGTDVDPDILKWTYHISNLPNHQHIFVYNFQNVTPISLHSIQFSQIH
jgi:hypothetical protein